jgi:hypothetical protein
LEWMKRRSVQRSAPATVSNKRVDEFCPLHFAWKWTVTVTTAFCGTVQYPNPERMTRHPEANRATSGQIPADAAFTVQLTYRRQAGHLRCRWGINRYAGTGIRERTSESVTK